MKYNDAFGDRMKRYENVTDVQLITRIPVILRIDGKAFHTFTRGFKRPFDDILIKTMQETALYLCESIQGAVFAYTQSDEISILLIDYANIDTSPWFDYRSQKMCSISASMATMQFNKRFRANIGLAINDSDDKYIEKMNNAAENGALFDARCFNIPKEDVTNYFYWRQLDASRNSVNMVGQAYFSHKELMHKSVNDIQDMLMLKYSINWNNYQSYLKRGSCIILNESSENPTPRFIIDKDIPIFKGDNRLYIDKRVFL